MTKQFLILYAFIFIGSFLISLICQAFFPAQLQFGISVIAMIIWVMFVVSIAEGSGALREDNNEKRK